MTFGLLMLIWSSILLRILRNTKKQMFGFEKKSSPKIFHLFVDGHIQQVSLITETF